MHKLWEILEIQDEIFSFVENSGSLAALARVRSCFWLPAASRIWQSVPSFQHLLALVDMPPSDDYAKPLPELQPSSWDRFRLYCPLVRRLGVDLKATYFFFLQNLGKQDSTPTLEAFLPRLTGLTLHLHNEPILFAPTLLPRFFFAPSLHTIHLRHPDRVQHDESLSSWAHCSQSLPPIRRLTLEYGTPANPRTLLNVYSILYRLPHIRSVDLKAQTIHPVMMYLWKDLTELRVEGLIHDPVTEGMNTEDFSQTLEKLDAAGSLEGLGGLLKLAGPACLKDLTLRTRKLTKQTLGGLLDDVGRFTNLTSFLLFSKIFLTVPWAVVEPLLLCSKLEDVVIILYSSTLHISNDNLVSISRSWPNLSRLVIYNGYAVTPSITLADLQGLASLASLKTLWISVDATTPNVSEITTPLETLQELNLVESHGRVRQETAVAATLKQLAPDLRKAWSLSDNATCVPPLASWRKIWNEFERLGGRRQRGAVEGPEVFEDPFE